MEYHRGLLNAVSSSVDKLVAYFSTTRNLVQKAQLGDSRISPEVGHLVLFGLSPALLAVLKNGLKLYQSDVIVGRRKNSVWRMVGASVKPGPETIPFYNLYCRICQLPQLSTSRMQFNAFIFGLLNHKLLEFWVLHLRQCTDMLSMHYEPKAFLSLSNSSLKHLFDELLLLLQPLSILTFNLDILFEHYHHFVEDAEQLSNHTVSKQTQKRTGILHESKRRENLSSSNQSSKGVPIENANQTPMQIGIKRPESDNIVNEGGIKNDCYGKLQSQQNVSLEEGLVGNSSRLFTQNKTSVEQSQNAIGETLQHTFEQVMQWGDRLAQNLVKFREQQNEPAYVAHVQVKSEEESSTVSHVNETAVGRKPVNWWEQLSQTSRVYISSNQEGSFFAKWLKPKTPEAVHNPIFSSNRHAESFRPKPLVLLKVLSTKEDPMEFNKGESVPVENSINNNHSECSFAQQKRETTSNDLGILQNTDDKSSDDSSSENRGTGECAVKSDDVDDECHYTKPEIHSSPASVLCDLRNSMNSSELIKSENAKTEMFPLLGRKMWMGRIFGATSPSNRTSQDEQGANHLKSRRPSSWLAPNLNIFSVTRKGKITERVMPPLFLEETDTVSSDEETKPQRAVKALCTHTGQGEHELSFEKGDVLQVVSNVDENWIRCCHEDKIGLVPVEYTSLIL